MLAFADVNTNEDIGGVMLLNFLHRSLCRVSTVTRNIASRKSLVIGHTRTLSSSASKSDWMTSASRRLPAEPPLPSRHAASFPPLDKACGGFTEADSICFGWIAMQTATLAAEHRG
jgi:hypothetical protein